MQDSNNSKTTNNRVGLDIGSHTINGVEVLDRGTEMAIRSAGAVPIPGVGGKQAELNTSQIVQAIKSLWSMARFESKKVVLALPPDAVYTKWIHLEASGLDELDQTARMVAVRGA